MKKKNTIFYYLPFAHLIIHPVFLPDLCLTFVFFISPRYYDCPKSNKVSYGRCANGELIIYFGPELIPLYSLKNILIILFIPRIVLSMIPHTLNCFFQFSHNAKNPNTGHRSPSLNIPSRVLTKLGQT